MKPIVLVLLIAASAFAAPSVNIGVRNLNEVGPAYDSGSRVNSGLIQNALSLIDNGDLTVYTVMLTPAIIDLANAGDTESQALAVSQTLAILLSLGNGIPGDSCAAANAINEFLSGGNGSSYSSSLSAAVGVVGSLGSNPASLKYSVGPRGGCKNGGRVYNFEAVWNGIFDSASPNAAGQVNEAYCAAKRLYNSNSVLNNNVAAAVTAASLPGVVNHVAKNLNLYSNALRSAVNGGRY